MEEGERNSEKESDGRRGKKYRKKERQRDVKK